MELPITIQYNRKSQLGDFCQKVELVMIIIYNNFRLYFGGNPCNKYLHLKVKHLNTTCLINNC